jgi:hypothetical protein
MRTALSLLLEDLLNQHNLRAELLENFDGVCSRYTLSPPEADYLLERLDLPSAHEPEISADGSGMMKYNNSQPHHVDTQKTAKRRAEVVEITNSDYYVRPVTVVTNTTTTNTVTFTTTTTTTTTTSPTPTPTPGTKSRAVEPTEFKARVDTVVNLIKNSSEEERPNQVHVLANLLAEA